MQLQAGRAAYYFSCRRFRWCPCPPNLSIYSAAEPYRRHISLSVGSQWAGEETAKKRTEKPEIAPLDSWRSVFKRIYSIYLNGFREDLTAFIQWKLYFNPRNYDGHLFRAPFVRSPRIIRIKFKGPASVVRVWPRMTKKCNLFELWA